MVCAKLSEVLAHYTNLQHNFQPHLQSIYKMPLKSFEFIIDMTKITLIVNRILSFIILKEKYIKIKNYLNEFME